ncbi:MAG: acyloxyacyl hydrolase [Beijerinckiaceae bacterium]|nr:acyloxyacyl hydrolase [Beijerinckiaceae bacterium]
MRRALPALCLLLIALPARSEEWRAPELRLGLLAHDIAGAETGSVSLAGDVLFTIPGREKAGSLGILIPRVQFGAIVNPAGRTSIAHAGIAWQVDLFGGFFAEAGFGLATHDGPTGLASRPGHAALGCRLLFREAGGLGYRFGSRWSVLASVEHFSNGGACTRNRGLTHAGLRMSYQF